MPQDFRSPREPAPTIGFHELRQACEISALREDLERLLQQSGGLRGHIEDAVELVRTRFAALSAEDLTDPATMAPLLQFAVSQLIAIREKARALDFATGPVGDDQRKSWDPVEASPRRKPASATHGPVPEPDRTAEREPPAMAGAPSPADDPPSRLPPPRVAPTVAPPLPEPAAPAPPTPLTPTSAFWLNPAGATTPPRSTTPARPAPGGAVDWLQPARR